MQFDPELETVLESLSFEARGETSNPSHPAVLSCGGIFFPRQTLPQGLRSWRQIVNVAASNVSARVFGNHPPDAKQDLETFLLKETLN